MHFPTNVTLIDVGPRDGLQSLDRCYSTAIKVQMVELLAATGLPKIEVTGFVRPDAVPQLADAADVLARIDRRATTVYRALCPNRKGADRAIAAGVDEILGMITASDTYNLKNSNMTVADNLVQAENMAEVACAAGVALVMGIGVCMFCPYEGEVPASRVLDMIDRMQAAGIDEFYLATSTGLDGPRKVYELFSEVKGRWPELLLGVHLHNTNGMGLANALAAMDAGATRFEGSVCGIGGGIRMPDAMAHFGNVPTEDLAHMFAEMDIETGVDLDGLIDASHRVGELLELEGPHSYVGRGGRKAAVLRDTASIAPGGAGDRAGAIGARGAASADEQP